MNVEDSHAFEAFCKMFGLDVSVARSRVTLGFRSDNEHLRPAVRLGRDVYIDLMHYPYAVQVGGMYIGAFEDTGFVWDREVA